MRPFRFKEAGTLFLLAFALLVLKSPDALTLPQFWAEDGAVFFEQQIDRSWPLLLAHYTGYLHTAPRLVAWLSSGLDPGYAPLAYNLAAISIDAACIAFVTMRLTPWFSRWPVLLSFFILPTAGDVFGTLTNVQWFMQFALAAACFTPQTLAASTAWRVAGYVGLGIAALTGPFSLLIGSAAVAARLAFTRWRDPSGVALVLAEAGRHVQGIPTLIAVGGAIVQAGLLGTSGNADVSDYWLRQDQVLSMGLDGLHSFYSATVNSPLMTWHRVQLIALATVLLVFLVSTLKRPSVPAVLGLLFIAVGAAQPVLAAAKLHRSHTLAVSSHYFYLLSVAAVWVGWDLLKRHFPDRLPAVVSSLAVTLAVLVAVEPNFFRREPLHDLHWKHYAALIDGRPLEIPLNPVPWRVKVPGGDLPGIARTREAGNRP
jgi:hypothetical protein